MTKLSHKEKTKLFHENIGVAHDIYLKYYNNGYGVDSHKEDLLQACMLGLWISLDTFDKNKLNGGSVYTWAKFYIMNECREVLRQKDPGISTKRGHDMERSKKPENVPPSSAYIDREIFDKMVATPAPTRPEEGELMKITKKIKGYTGVPKNIETIIGMKCAGHKEPAIAEALGSTRQSVSQKTKVFLAKCRDLAERDLI